MYKVSLKCKVEVWRLYLKKKNVRFFIDGIENTEVRFFPPFSFPVFP